MVHDLTLGDLVSWHTPSGRLVLGLVVEEETGHGGGATGWFRVLSDLGHGPRKYLVRPSNCLVLERVT
jgi:uncharacterized protein YijF (DUF1287 family)